MKNPWLMFVEFCKNKNIDWLVPIATGTIAVAAGVALLYLLPPYIVSILNQTALFTVAQVAAATAAITTITALSFLVIVIGMLWVVIGIVSSQKGK
jgi:type IV secretory pathway component VirB8